jgi:hypothetical protein
MKTTILFFMTFILLASCTKDNTNNINAQLPPETQTGANTFGVTINGKVYIPRDPTGFSTFPSTKGMVLWGATDFSWYEIEVKDGASSVGFKMIIHIDHLASVGKIMLQQSNFHDSYDSGHFTHIFFKIWDAKISNYTYYGSVANQGEINITRLTDGIVSGNFKGKFVRYDNPNEFITITDGRFDINGFTLPNAVFP